MQQATKWRKLRLYLPASNLPILPRGTRTLPSLTWIWMISSAIPGMEILKENVVSPAMEVVMKNIISLGMEIVMENIISLDMEVVLENIIS